MGVYTPFVYTMLWPTYAIDWSLSRGIVIGSFMDEDQNEIEILKNEEVQQVQGKESLGGVRFRSAGKTMRNLVYPVTKVLWKPCIYERKDKKMFASTGDALRLWSVKEGLYEPIIEEMVLEHRQHGTNQIAPTTSFDWNQVAQQLIVTASVDTTCIIWDIEVGEAKSKLIAHDREVFDVSFLAHSADVFVSTGAEGSMRMFDLRSLEHSTILYETGGELDAYTSEPLLRVSANTLDQNLLATFHLDSNVVHILDIRFPGTPVLNIAGHDGNINCVKWAPGCRNICATGGEDCQILIWNTTKESQNPNTLLYKSIRNQEIKQLNNPIFSWNANSEINNLCWSDDAEWIGVCWGKNFQGLKV
ncbi:hypothetical protein T552_02863 [Pneumocystis carinii B80]|uniref:Uncharacterized protein n=1 Tax=Pneumocystis carinii (strain B80) TaxID=1408658 RepID=A0A0W4ZDB2_PNEC8|nr:hypothetical protein T552_02863 [Pneumocystis carinii B80]KTW26381.1 hypothetical protein T552_02863 [Pneumocystis carinii B80]